MKTFVIAEAGVNHNGSLDLACQLIDAAKNAGADAVKFQTFKTERLVLEKTPKAEYQKVTTSADESQYEMLKKLELSFDEFRKLKQHCESIGIEFMSTGFDSESIGFLQSLDLARYKIPSGELTNAPLVWQVARQRKPIILSTGMASLGEIEFALAVICFALGQDNPPANKTQILQYFSQEVNRRPLANYVTLLHCTSSYPTQAQDVNLNAMQSMEKCFGVAVGYSDHTIGYVASLAAVAKGATVIEKHFTLSKDLPGPDHKASLDVQELTRFVADIRELDQMLGDGRKVPQTAEFCNRLIARQRLVALKAVKKGELFTPETLGTSRSVSGLDADLYWDLLYTKASYDYEAMEAVCHHQLNH
ncbi:N-acetylneuraminate synthase [Rheinheimera sp. SA_1]|uniref:N-acetylneuraminate synthase n=1 Tax=Rheinheimera sp. SA_1 TaxID=1827365 RepID=UPI0007FE143F|nr:N-acetylneuraminate synthase [Rheinheimera sp. SA_1]OBP15400.1 N-acetylneuraminate synthase [Rheinheimera sp. SA_1]